MGKQISISGATATIESIEINGEKWVKVPKEEEMMELWKELLNTPHMREVVDKYFIIKK